MKFFTIIFCLIFLSNFSFAQEVHYFNKAVINQESFNFCLSSFEVTDGFLVLNYEQMLQGGAIYLNLLKLDEFGNIQWKKRLGEVAFFPPVNTMIRDKKILIIFWYHT
ncbi:MAG: hypothetical protein R3E32_14435 [Chitinophagales bacterium]